MKRTLAFLATVAALLLSSCSDTNDKPGVDPTEMATKATSGNRDEYAASIKASILNGTGLDTTTQACEQGIDWICYISEITSSTESVATVTVQIVESDKEFGTTVPRGVYDLASAEHPKLRRVQVNNATYVTIADETFT